MTLTSIQSFVIIGAVALATMLTRFLPFIIFPESKPVPPYIAYLGKRLPSAVIGLLVVYCFKNVSVTSSPYGVPELITILVIILLHKLFNNTLLSIGGGTICYMLFCWFL